MSHDGYTPTTPLGPPPPGDERLATVPSLTAPVRAHLGKSPASAPLVPVTVACVRCQDMGYVIDDRDYLHPAKVACPCQDEKRRTRREALFAELSGDDLRPYLKTRLGSLTPNVEQARAVAHVQRFVEKPVGTLVLLGSYGSGKTSLAVATCYSLCRSIQPMFRNTVALIDDLKNALRDPEGIAFRQHMDRLCSVGLLVLDDVGAEQATDWSSSALFRIWQERSSAGLPTILTTNHALEGLGSRLASRLLQIGQVYLIVVRAPDMRSQRPTEATAWSVEGWPGDKTATRFHRRGKGGQETVICPTCDGRPCLPSCPSQEFPDPSVKRRGYDDLLLEMREAEGLCAYCSSTIPGRHDDECVRGVPF